MQRLARCPQYQAPKWEPVHLFITMLLVVKRGWEGVSQLSSWSVFHSLTGRHRKRGGGGDQGGGGSTRRPSARYPCRWPCWRIQRCCGNGLPRRAPPTAVEGWGRGRELRRWRRRSGSCLRRRCWSVADPPPLQPPCCSSWAPLQEGICSCMLRIQEGAHKEVSYRPFFNWKHGRSSFPEAAKQA